MLLSSMFSVCLCVCVCRGGGVIRYNKVNDLMSLMLTRGPWATTLP